MRTKFNQNLKTILFLLAIGFATLNYTDSYAQIRKLKEKIGGKKEKKTENTDNKKTESTTKNTESTTNTNTQTEVKESKKNEEQKEEKLPALVYDRPFPPGIVYHSLLNHFKFDSDGYFDLHFISIAFLHEKTETGEAVNYREEARFHIKLKKDGVEISDKYYIPNNVTKIYTKFYFYDNIKKNNIANAKNPLENGKYVLEFYLDDKMFGHFPFEVISMKNDDPYAEITEKKFAKGMWEEYGYINWEEKPAKDVEPCLYWNTFNQLIDMKESKKYLNICYEMYKDGKYYATTGTNKTGVENKWGINDCVFFCSPKNEKIDIKKQLRKNNLVDGKYEIKTYYDNDKTPKGIYKFEVSGGKILPTERQDRTKANPLEFIEGLNDTFWVKKQ